MFGLCIFYCYAVFQPGKFSVRFGWVWIILAKLALREMCPNTEVFLVRIFLYSVRIKEDQKKLRIWTLFPQCWISSWYFWPGFGFVHSWVVSNRDTYIVCVIDLAFFVLNHFSQVSHFYTSWKRQKTFGFLTFSGSIEMWHWTKVG